MPPESPARLVPVLVHVGAEDTPARNPVDNELGISGRQVTVPCCRPGRVQKPALAHLLWPVMPPGGVGAVRATVSTE